MWQYWYILKYLLSSDILFELRKYGLPNFFKEYAMYISKYHDDVYII